MCVHKVKKNGLTLDQLVGEDILNDLRNSGYKDAIELTDKNGIRVLHMNIQSLSAKSTKLSLLLTDLKNSVDVILLCETYVKHYSLSTFNIHGYNCEHIFRTGKRGGGCSIYVRENLSYVSRADLNVMHDNWECIFIELILGKKSKNFIIGELYRRPNTNVDAFIEWYSRLLTNIDKENKNVLIGMDHNLDLLKMNTINYIDNFFNVNLNAKYTPCILVPTRVTHSTATLIDNIFIKCDLEHESCVLVNDCSDHYGCVVDVKIGKVQHDNISVTRKINSENITKVRTVLQNRNWANEFKGKTLNAKCDQLFTVIENTVNFYMPYKVRQERFFTFLPAWVDKEILELIKEKDKLYKKSLKNINKIKEYKQRRNKIQHELRKKKQKFFQEKIEKYKSNSRVLWGLINNVTKRCNNKKEISNEFLLNGIIETDRNQIANEFCTFYQNIAKNTIQETKAKGKIKSVVKPKPDERVAKSMFIYDTTMSEISREIDTLKDKTSHGYDGFSNRLLKEFKNELLYPLYEICNDSLRTGQFPDAMKKSVIKPLYKKNSKLEIKNYRPISLLPVMSKILEKVMCNRLVKFLEKNNCLYEGQYGFRKNRGTVDAVTDSVISILNSIESNKKCALILLDMSKAFDCISHCKLLVKLDKLGIRGHANDWFKSYLQNRKIVVNYKGTTSKELEVDVGTAQGSVLGPLIYIMFTNDMIKSLRFSEGIIFADDTSIVCEGNSIAALFAKIKQDLTNLYNYFIDNDLALNLSKTCYILFNHVGDTSHIIEVAGHTIERVSYSKFLGLFINEKLDWNEHCNYVKGKIKSGIYALSKSQKYLDIKTLLIMYNAIVVTHIQYGLLIWGPMITKSNLNRLQVLLNQCIRIIFDIKPRQSVKHVMKENKILSINNHIEIAKAKFMYRYMNDTISTRICKKVEALTKVRHNYNTRHRNDPNIPIHKSKLYSNSFIVKAPGLWMTLPEVLKSKPNLKLFSRQIKKQLLS